MNCLHFFNRNVHQVSDLFDGHTFFQAQEMTVRSFPGYFQCSGILHQLFVDLFPANRSPTAAWYRSFLPGRSPAFGVYPQQGALENQMPTYRTEKRHTRHVKFLTYKPESSTDCFSSSVTAGWNAAGSKALSIVLIQ